MTRVVVCGTAFASAVDLLGLAEVDERADLVLVDLSDPEALARAGGVPPAVPRIVLGSSDHELLLRALGVTAVALATSASAAALGPLITAATPARGRGATRLAVVTAVAGGSGRTLLAVNLAMRLATRASVLLVDITGSGAAAWWLRLAPGPWSDLEGLVDELTAEHLAIVAAEQGRLRLIGGRSAMPSVPCVLAVARASASIADLVLVDAPSVRDERTRAVMEVADRVLVLAAGDGASAATLDGIPDGEGTWIIGSRGRRGRYGDHVPLRSLPDDPAAVRAAARGPDPVAGALGRVYDELADLLALDAE